MLDPSLRFGTFADCGYVIRSPVIQILNCLGSNLCRVDLAVIECPKFTIELGQEVRILRIQFRDDFLSSRCIAAVALPDSYVVHEQRQPLVI